MRYWRCYLFLTMAVTALYAAAQEDTRPPEAPVVQNKPLVPETAPEKAGSVDPPINSLEYFIYERGVKARGTAEAPVDFDIHTKSGDLIQVRHEKLLAQDVRDRCDLVFSISSSLHTAKTFVLSNDPIVLSPQSPGPKTVTIYTGFDYNSYDKVRPRMENGRVRSRPFDRRAITAMNTARQIALFDGAGITKEGREEVRTLSPLFDVHTTVDVGREMYVQVYPGYKITFLWAKE
ncbi:MAG: hypothetical protein HYV27_13395 [Candidatus Hydrogenedentes bacterium]|nr:hypothetical protein [Candidatus Hydrogenedentota bacterium]